MNVGHLVEFDGEFLDALEIYQGELFDQDFHNGSISSSVCKYL
jgi:hypothetical protein